jgi:hypothetical protein
MLTLKSRKGNAVFHVRDRPFRVELRVSALAGAASRRVTLFLRRDSSQRNEQFQTNYFQTGKES